MLPFDLFLESSADYTENQRLRIRDYLETMKGSHEEIKGKKRKAEGCKKGEDGEKKVGRFK